MKAFALLALFGVASFCAHAQSSEDIFDRLTPNAVIFSEEGHVQGSENIEGFISEFEGAKGTINYKHLFTKKVNAQLEYKIGELETNNGVFAVMFLRQTGQSNQDIELLTLYKKTDTTDQITHVDQSRNEWMELCNAHDADNLVQQKYTPNAYYYNRGRLLQGTQAISKEYSYMNNSSYSLKLSPLHVEFVTSTIAYEIGQCSGSYPLPYMLLWEKQNDGRWLVLMDSNY